MQGPGPFASGRIHVIVCYFKLPRSLLDFFSASIEYPRVSHVMSSYLSFLCFFKICSCARSIELQPWWSLLETFPSLDIELLAEYLSRQSHRQIVHIVGVHAKCIPLTNLMRSPSSPTLVIKLLCHAV